MCIRSSKRPFHGRKVQKQLINNALLNTKRAIKYVGRFKGQKPAVPSESVCVPVPIGGAFPAGCRDGDAALWGLGSPWYCEAVRQDDY